VRVDNRRRVAGAELELGAHDAAVLELLVRVQVRVTVRRVGARARARARARVWGRVWVWARVRPGCAARPRAQVRARRSWGVVEPS